MVFSRDALCSAVVVSEDRTQGQHPSLNDNAFIHSVVDFVLVARVLFLVIERINTAKTKFEV